MKDYVIYADASGDYDLELCKSAGVQFISMQCESEGKVFDCTGCDDEDKLKGFYTDLAHGSLPKTTQITPFRYEEIFEPVLESGKSALCLCLSSGLSSTFESAKHAAATLAERYDGVKFVPVDSIEATTTMGLLLDRAIFNYKKGLGIDENFADLETFKHFLTAQCYVDDLHHLHRGGRLSAAGAALGSLLKIKPIIELNPAGKLDNIDKCRGVHKSLAYLAEQYKALADMSYPDMYISDAANSEFADELADLIREINPNINVKRRILSPIIGTHLGPNSVVTGFVRKEAKY